MPFVTEIVINRAQAIPTPSKCLKSALLVEPKG